MKEEIVFITKEGRKAAVYFAGGKINTNESLTALEERLEKYQFYRSHSGFIVNLNMIREIIPISRNTFELVMAHTRERPLMTYEKFKEFEKLFNW
ncbi:LytTR family DNA-binding domain-containing protein [Desulfoscipio geothermicus]|uniref:LytTr DNA-binding domain-containing protein n=1 Tax=Desulfoscipio geothermicus DSM 3669 TaxID=1121426 RepID=A0A1I6E672_9FIRM|nr:LytTR family DNA-binding domain-containing protein [Desulfoscipio geothermicus]SFR13244.1 LytTr DNA-binding domain-containing protein [Desulfoscipio geothermicus DSM 3669]